RSGRESTLNRRSPLRDEEISITAKRFEHLRSSFTAKCIDHVNEVPSFYFPGQYSVDGCYHSCYQDQVLKECG
ncbi:hypothetical protein PMAYCL1PPCAC_03747, partial [Pristionchus mayeri]